MIRWLFIALIFVLPFVVINRLSLPYEPLKVITAEILIALIAGFAQLKWPINWRSVLRQPLFVPTIIIIGLAVIDIVFMRTATTLLGNPFRLQGTILLLFLIGLAWLAPLFPMKRVPPFVRLGAFVGLVIGMMAMAETLGGRLVGPLGEPNALAAEMIFFAVVLWFAPVTERLLRLIIRAVVILGVCLTVLYTDSRAAVVAVAICMVTGLLWQWTKLPRKIIIVIVLAALFASFFLPFHDRATTYENRKDVWRVAFAAGTEHPILGSGFGNIEYRLHWTAVRLDNPVWYQYVDSSHNIFLDWWVSGGIVGLGVFLWLVGRSFINFATDDRLPELVALAGLLTVLSFNPASVATLVAFWWLIGIGMQKEKSKE